MDSGKLDLRLLLDKEIQKRVCPETLNDSNVVFVPTTMPRYVSKTFDTDAEVSRYEQLGFDIIPTSEKAFEDNGYFVSDLWKSLVGQFDEGDIQPGSFDVKGLTKEAIEDYINAKEELYTTFNSQNVKTLQEFDNLQNEYLGMTPKERKKSAGVILYKKMTKTRKKINSAKKNYMSEVKKFQSKHGQQPELDMLLDSLAKIKTYKQSFNVSSLSKAGKKQEDLTNLGEVSDKEMNEPDPDAEDIANDNAQTGTYLKCSITPPDYQDLFKFNPQKGENNHDRDRFRPETFNMKQIMEESGQSSSSFNASLSVGWGPFSGNASAKGSKTQSSSHDHNEEVSIKMDLTSINVSRRWFDINVLKSDNIGSKGCKAGKWSLGKTAYSKEESQELMFPFLTQKIIVARNIEISGLKIDTDMQSRASEIEASGGISFMGIGGANGGYSKSESSSSFSQNLQTGTIKQMCPTIIGYLCQAMPKFPKFDSDKVAAKTWGSSGIKKPLKAFGAMHYTKNLKQGNSETCVRAAIATAVTEQIGCISQKNNTDPNGKVDYDKVIQINQKAVYEALCNIKINSKANKPCDPTEFHQSTVNAPDVHDENRYFIKIEVEEKDPSELSLAGQKQVKGYIPGYENYKYIMGYDVVKHAKARGKKNVNVNEVQQHCISIYDIQGDGKVIGFNSWQNIDPKPEFDFNKDEDLHLWKVTVKECHQFGTDDNSIHNGFGAVCVGKIACEYKIEVMTNTKVNFGNDEEFAWHKEIDNLRNYERSTFEKCPSDYKIKMIVTRDWMQKTSNSQFKCYTCQDDYTEQQAGQFMYCCEGTNHQYCIDCAGELEVEAEKEKPEEKELEIKQKVMIYRELTIMYERTVGIELVFMTEEEDSSKGWDHYCCQLKRIQDEFMKDASRRTDLGHNLEKYLLQFIVGKLIEGGYHLFAYFESIHLQYIEEVKDQQDLHEQLEKLKQELQQAKFEISQRDITIVDTQSQFLKIQQTVKTYCSEIKELKRQIAQLQEEVAECKITISQQKIEIQQKDFKNQQLEQRIRDLTFNDAVIGDLGMKQLNKIRNKAMDEDKQSNIKLYLKQTKSKIQQNLTSIKSSNGRTIDRQAMFGDESIVQLFQTPDGKNSTRQTLQINVNKSTRQTFQINSSEIKVEIQKPRDLKSKEKQDEKEKQLLIKNQAKKDNADKKANEKASKAEKKDPATVVDKKKKEDASILQKTPSNEVKK